MKLKRIIIIFLILISNNEVMAADFCSSMPSDGVGCIKLECGSGCNALSALCEDYSGGKWWGCTCNCGYDQPQEGGPWTPECEDGSEAVKMDNGDWECVDGNPPAWAPSDCNDCNNNNICDDAEEGVDCNSPPEGDGPYMPTCDEGEQLILSGGKYYCYTSSPGEPGGTCGVDYCEDPCTCNKYGWCYCQQGDPDWGDGEGCDDLNNNGVCDLYEDANDVDDPSDPAPGLNPGEEDDDGDGIPNDYDEDPYWGGDGGGDNDGDGINNNEDYDIDGDGVDNGNDDSPFYDDGNPSDGNSNSDGGNPNGTGGDYGSGGGDLSGGDSVGGGSGSSEWTNDYDLCAYEPSCDCLPWYYESEIVKDEDTGVICWHYYGITTQEIPYYLICACTDGTYEETVDGETEEGTEEVLGLEAATVNQLAMAIKNAVGDNLSYDEVKGLLGQMADDLTGQQSEIYTNTTDYMKYLTESQLAADATNTKDIIDALEGIENAVDGISSDGDGDVDNEDIVNAIEALSEVDENLELPGVPEKEGDIATILDDYSDGINESEATKFLKETNITFTNVSSQLCFNNPISGDDNCVDFAQWEDELDNVGTVLFAVISILSAFIVFKR